MWRGNEKVIFKEVLADIDHSADLPSAVSSTCGDQSLDSALAKGVYFTVFHVC